MSTPFLTLLVCAPSVFAFWQAAKDSGHRVHGNPDYQSLLDVLQTHFPNRVFDPKLAFVAINLEKESQKKFSGFLHHLGFLVDITDFRDAFILPDRTTSYQRLSTRITYVAGLLAHKKPHLVVVTDAFDVYYPLLDIVQNRGGEATVAFFRSGLETRWERVGLFSEESPIKFVDLDPYAQEIIGVDLKSKKDSGARKGGLGSLKV